MQRLHFRNCSEELSTEKPDPLMIARDLEMSAMHLRVLCSHTEMYVLLLVFCDHWMKDLIDLDEESIITCR